MVGRICGTGSYVPAEVWENDRLAEMVDTSDEWIKERTGVSRRHIANGKETTAFMAAQAGVRAMEDAGTRAEDIDLIIAATISPGEVMPCTACEVQEQTGAKNATCFDLNAACTGFLLALNTAMAYIGQGIYRTALVIGAETLSNLTNWEDRTTCILFGDGAGAVVVKAEAEGVFTQVTHSIGEKGQALTLTSRNQSRYQEAVPMPETYMRMDGKEVFKFAISKVPEAVNELLDQAQMVREDIRYYLLHQANERIVRSVAKKLCVPMDKFPTNMEEYGNTSSASIPILMDELNKAQRLCPGDYLVVAGFGGGLTCGASLIKW